MHELWAHEAAFRFDWARRATHDAIVDTERPKFNNEIMSEFTVVLAKVSDKCIWLTRRVYAEKQMRPSYDIIKQTKHLLLNFRDQMTSP